MQLLISFKLPTITLKYTRVSNSKFAWSFLLLFYYNLFLIIFFERVLSNFLESIFSIHIKAIHLFCFDLIIIEQLKVCNQTIEMSSLFKLVLFLFLVLVFCLSSISAKDVKLRQYFQEKINFNIIKKSFESNESRFFIDDVKNFYKKVKEDLGHNFQEGPPAENYEKHDPRKNSSTIILFQISNNGAQF